LAGSSTPSFWSVWCAVAFVILSVSSSESKEKPSSVPTHTGHF
jgi:hypothetical protein